MRRAPEEELEDQSVRARRWRDKKLERGEVPLFGWVPSETGRDFRFEARRLGLTRDAFLRECVQTRLYGRPLVNTTPPVKTAQRPPAETPVSTPTLPGASAPPNLRPTPAAPSPPQSTPRPTVEGVKRFRDELRRR